MHAPTHGTLSSQHPTLSNPSPPHPGHRSIFEAVDIRTSARLCSAACADFFQRDPAPMEEAPQRADARRDARRGQFQLHSPSVMSDRPSTRPRMKGAWATMCFDRRSPPKALVATEPASRCKAHQRTALEAFTPKRAAASRRDMAPATAATTLSRRSTGSALDRPVGLLADRQLESEFTRARNRCRFTRPGTRSKDTGQF